MVAVLEVIHCSAPEKRCRCSKCRAEHMVPIPEFSCLDSDRLRVPSASNATVEVMERHLAWDPDARDVEALMSLVDSVSAFGSLDLPCTLGHPLVLQRVVMYTNRFACPACDPWAFGMSRAYAATVMAHGLLRFDEAVSLAERTMRLVLPEEFTRAPRHYNFGKLKRMDVRGLSPRTAEVVLRLEITLLSVELGMDSDLFAGWSK